MIVELHDLKHVYPSGDIALAGVTMTFEGTDSVAIIGQNGAGKTTLAKHFNGILKPTDGTLLIDGVDVTDRTTAEWSRTVGYIFQNPDDQLFLESVRKEFSFGPKQIHMDSEVIERRIKEVAELVGLAHRLDMHPFDLTPNEKRFCAIGAILTMDPSIVIFDEPTCGQDRKGIARLSKIITYLHEAGKLCIIISHDMKFVTTNCSRAVVLCHGSVLLDGPVDEVFAQPEMLRRSFVTPPPVTRVGQGAGLKETVFSVPAFVNAIAKERKNNRD